MSCRIATKKRTATEEWNHYGFYDHSGLISIQKTGKKCSIEIYLAKSKALVLRDYKAHIGVDKDRSWIYTVKGTSINIHVSYCPGF